jgi:hypothetical protein
MTDPIIKADKLLSFIRQTKGFRHGASGGPQDPELWECEPYKQGYMDGLAEKDAYFDMVREKYGVDKE